MKKSVIKNKKKSQSNLFLDGTSEVDLKYKLALCWKNLKEPHHGIEILDSIPQKQRTPRINYLLGDLYLFDKKDDHALAYYREVLRECPFSLKVILNMIKLGVKANDIFSSISVTNNPNFEWLSKWIKAQCFLHSPDVNQAIPLFRSLLSTSDFRNNADLLQSLGEALYYNGEYKEAIIALRKAHVNDLSLWKGLDFYAACLYRENQLKELEKLANELVRLCELDCQSPEPWIVLGYYCLSVEKFDKKDLKEVRDQKISKAQNFVEKACRLSNNSVEALILGGLIELKINAEIANDKTDRTGERTKDLLRDNSLKNARNYFTEALVIGEYRFEGIRGLIDVFLALNKKSLASSLVSNAFKILGQNPRTLTVRNPLVELLVNLYLPLLNPFILFCSFMRLFYSWIQKKDPTRKMR